MALDPPLFLAAFRRDLKTGAACLGEAREALLFCRGWSFLVISVEGSSSELSCLSGDAVETNGWTEWKSKRKRQQTQNGSDLTFPLPGSRFLWCHWAPFFFWFGGFGNFDQRLVVRVAVSVGLWRDKCLKGLNQTEAQQKNRGETE